MKNSNIFKKLPWLPAICFISMLALSSCTHTDEHPREHPAEHPVSEHPTEHPNR